MELVTANLNNRLQRNLIWLPANNYDANEVEYVALIDYVIITPNTGEYVVEKLVRPSSFIDKSDKIYGEVRKRAVIGSK